MKRFLTIFPPCENVHLTKDVGMIPYVLFKEYGYQSTIASFENGSYPYLNSEVKGLSQKIIPRKFKNSNLNVALFILKNYRQYDILQCYHPKMESVFFLNFFKLLKCLSLQKSIAFLKLDANNSILELRKNRWKNLSLLTINLISSEVLEIQTHLNQNNIFGKKVVYLPNGINKINKDNQLNFENKKNLIITVGRIGSSEKNNELLLEGFKLFAQKEPSYLLEFVGEPTDEFRKLTQNLIERNPFLKGRITLRGLIQDKELLNDKFVAAKIFVLSSVYEGFPLVFLEALNGGCTIITTPVSAANDITQNGEIGMIIPFNDANALSEALLETTQNESKMKDNFEKGRTLLKKQFNWSLICGNLDKLLQSQ